MRRPFSRSIALLAILGAAVCPAAAQTGVEPLAPFVTTADRLPESSATVGADIDAVSGADLGERQDDSLADALAALPGSAVFATGQRGASASVFLRGANSDQALFLVDGIRASDPDTDYGMLLGGARIL